MKFHIDDDRNPSDDIGLHERLSAASESMIPDIDLALNEIFSGFHPNITQKELCILKEILWTIHDIGDGMYEQVIIRVLKEKKISSKIGKKLRI